MNKKIILIWDIIFGCKHNIRKIKTPKMAICYDVILTLYYVTFNVYGSVHRKNIPLHIQQDATSHSLLYLETALHVSGGTSIHHQERKQLYLQHLVFVTTLLLPAAIVEELELLCSSNSSMITEGSSNVVTNTRSWGYSCLRS